MPTIRASPRSASANGDASRAGGDVEHDGGLGHHRVIDHLAPPPPVLAERQHRGQAVVATGQAGEQRPDERRR